MDPAELGRAAVAVMMDQIEARCTRSAWSFDRWAYESALHEGDPSPVAHTLAILERAGAHLPQRRRAVAAHDRLRRRQGPRAGALERRAHLLRLGHRLPPGQARARLRPPDRRVGRRPPRLRAADEGRLRGARRRPRAARAADHAARAPGALGRARADVQARGRVRDARRPRRPRSAWTPRAGICSRARTTRPSTSTSTSRASSRARTPSTTSSTRTRGSPRCSRRRAQERVRGGAGGRGGRRASRCTPPSAR